MTSETYVANRSPDGPRSAHASGPRVTPATLVRHELAGLDVEVADATDPGQVGIAGTIRDETTRTLVVATDEGDKRVPKATATFRFVLDDAQSTDGDGEHAVGGDRTRVLVDGERLVARPARRTEATGGSRWH